MVPLWKMRQETVVLRGIANRPCFRLQIVEFFNFVKDLGTSENRKTHLSGFSSWDLLEKWDVLESLGVR